MIIGERINAITKQEIFKNKLKVVRVGSELFNVVGFNYGEEEHKLTGYANDVAHFLNGYFGDRIIVSAMEDGFTCSCGNQACDSGFFPCDKEGVNLVPEEDDWEGYYKCDNDQCNQIYLYQEEAQ